MNEVPVALSAGVQVPASERVTVWHLEDHGGPTAFDLTDPVKHDRWGDILSDREKCDGTDFWTPFVVIVDGLTAILGGRPERYAEWDAAFRQLMRARDVPNALWVGHSTMQGNHGMGASRRWADLTACGPTRRTTPTTQVDPAVLGHPEDGREGGGVHHRPTRPRWSAADGPG